MEIDTQSSESLANLMAPATAFAQKRKRQSLNGDCSSGQDSSEGLSVASRSIDHRLPKGEYETGRVVCEACGEGVSFRDEATGGFTVQQWEAHRLECPNSVQQVPDAISQTGEIQFDALQPQTKRRRAKRTEEERVNYLQSDPYVAQFEAYRVLCACCDKWIRLRPNSTYCSIPWDAHRKSCLAKRAAKAAFPADDRNALFANDPNVRKFDAERVLCKICETWIPLGNADSLQAVKTWMGHRAACRQIILTSPSTPGVPVNIPSVDSVPPPAKHLLALACSSSLPVLSSPDSYQESIGAGAMPGSASSASFKAFNPTNFPPAHESRRRNAEQRAAQLRADPFIGDLEPNRVFCALCQKWVQLRQDSSYCAYPWQQHRSKCLKRQEKRSQREAQLAQLRARTGCVVAAEVTASENGDEDSDEPESEEGVESGDDEEKERRRAVRREERRWAKAQAKLATLSTHLTQDGGKVNGVKRRTTRSASEYSEATGEDCMDVDVPHSFTSPTWTRLRDGELDYALRAVRYLFRSTYERTDELTIAALVTYLNAAMPPDKHEDFDTAEVTKAATALRERGCFAFEGDVIRMLN